MPIYTFKNLETKEEYDEVMSYEELQEYLKQDTTQLPVGFFWCEWFEGRHVSVDYKDGVQVLAVEGTKPDNTFTQWTKWHRVDDEFPLPSILTQFNEQYLNCEYIDGKLIEVHFRRNEDFDYATEEFIPVWEGENTTPPEGYSYIQYPDVHGRIGAFVK
jgi:hypothetical protein